MAEVIGRHSADESRPALFVQQEQLRIRPHVARIGRNKEGQVADQPHTPGRGHTLSDRCLPEQQELRETNLVDLVSRAIGGLRESRRITLDQFRRPLEIVALRCIWPSTHEQRVIFQPVARLWQNSS